MLSIDCMLEDFQQYIASGDSFVRGSRGRLVSGLIVSLQRIGVDAQSNIRSFLPDLKRIQVSVRQLRRTWLILGCRFFGALSSAVVLRFVLRAMGHHGASQGWISLDRQFFLVATMCIIIVLLWGVHRYLMFGWSRSKELMVWQIIASCLYARRWPPPGGNVFPEMKKIFQDEIRSGLDGGPSRLAFLTGRLQLICDEVENEVASMVVIGAGLELLLFILGHLGFSVVPFLAWLESVSGVD